jgi:L-threonylcarbamoyladenylate synthase
VINFAKTSQKSCAALLFGDDMTPDCKFVILPNQAEQAAEQLYSALHTMDAFKVEQLLVEMPPYASDWLAILDRLIRAAH